MSKDDRMNFKKAPVSRVEVAAGPQGGVCGHEAILIQSRCVTAAVEVSSLSIDDELGSGGRMVVITSASHVQVRVQYCRYVRWA